MEIVNGSMTTLHAGQGLDTAGRPRLVVVAKATYTLPEGDAEAVPAAVQRGLLISDLFEAEPGYSPARIEADMVPRKLACDVIVAGTAHAPNARPVQSFIAEVAVGGMRKAVRVVGERRWRRGILGDFAATRAAEVAAVPLSYSKAFGGMYDHTTIGGKDPQIFLRHPENLVGCGYYDGAFLRLADGSPLPQFEALDDPVTAPQRLHKPAGFGPIARNWTARRQHGGTYDQRWLDTTFPLLPPDFDDRYYQCAPRDQQIAFPRGGEHVTLTNLRPGGGTTSFRLPTLDMPMAVIPRDRRPVRLYPVIDTIVIDTDAATIDLVWRAEHPLRRDLHEVLSVAAGKVCKRWWESRVFGAGDCGCAGKETDDDDLISVHEAVSI
jgi:hypothetical protein